MDAVMEGLQGVAKSKYDFLVFGKTTKEPNRCLEALPTRFKENGLTLNTDKSEFHKLKVDFLDYHLFEERIKPLATKTEAIIDLKQPENVTELQCFIGMTQ